MSLQGKKILKTQFSSERSSVDPGAKVPNFVGVGPPKCATTWLDAMLRQHPQVFLPKHQKEVFYFDRYHDRGDDWYKALFKAARDQTAIGEISTSYLTSSDALDRLHAYNPDVKIVIILRHPVARMVSHFRMLRENGRTKENFEASVGHYSVLRNASSYAANLAHLFSLFPREQVHLAIYEEIFADPDAASGYLTSLQNFLGVLPHDGQAAAGKTKVRETMGAPRSDWLIKRAKKTRRWLRQYDLE